jgi:AraC-like DNA-binding protein
MAPFGGMLRDLVRHDSQGSAITRAIAQIRRDFRSPIAIPALARSVGMSASSFHKHFKAVTASSPLQYQKDLRLLEARRLLRTGATSVSTAAYDVGYESPTQFSREYARKFGVPPKRDLPPAGAPTTTVATALQPSP